MDLTASGGALKIQPELPPEKGGALFFELPLAGASDGSMEQGF
ncbi:hypothetical protein [Methylocystis hirsuta]|nr:hypothetical protein [Methylocystis hirsuta]